MSVINQMLRDLDARAAGDSERAGLPPRLRTLPPTTLARRQNWQMLALGLGLGAVLAGATVALLLRPSAPPAAQPPAPPPVESPPVTPVVPPPAAPATVPSAPTSVQPAIDMGEMKLSTLLLQTQQSLPEKAPAPPKPAVVPPKQVPAPVVPKPAVETQKPTPQAKPTPSPRVEAAPAEAQIDKRARGGQAGEMAEAEYRKGMQAVKRGDNAAALPLFQHALELDPLLAKARQALLSVLVGARQWNEAQKAAHDGLALDPAQPGWAMILARLQFEQGDAAGAIETLGRHAAHAQNDADYQGLFAYLLQKQQRPAEAAERFKAALALRPNEGRWWFGLGLAQEGAGRAGEAREAYLKAREIGNLPSDMGSVIEQKLK